MLCSCCEKETNVGYGEDEDMCQECYADYCDWIYEKYSDCEK